MTENGFERSDIISTKSTIAHGNDPAHDFHFYHECFDEDAVYLEMRGACAAEFQAGPDHVMVRIPIEIWETIRGQAPANTEFATWTDQVAGLIFLRAQAHIPNWHQLPDFETLYQDFPQLRPLPPLPSRQNGLE